MALLSPFYGIRILDQSTENHYQTRPLEFFFRTKRIYIETNIQAELSPFFYNIYLLLSFLFNF
ncbi:MAG: hypothetical protein CMI29_02235 [Opitutae bacterium]|nr:hypothetical protein [Opitutae bacterium]